MENRVCPECKKSGHDTDEDHLFLMSEGNRWCCNKREYHSSGKNYYEGIDGQAYEDTSVADVLKQVEASARDGVPEDTEGDSSGSSQGSLDSLITEEKKERGEKREEGIRVDKDVVSPYRSISPHTFKCYEVIGSYEGKDLKRLSHPIYEVDSGQLCTKYRELPKDFKTYGTSTKGKKIELFGQRIARSSKTLVITEGEIDALSLEEVLKKSKYAKPAIVSLPFGANLKALVDNKKFISTYKRLVVCPDNDKAGISFANNVATMYPDALFMDLGSYKDLNEMLEDGKDAEILSAYFSAEQYKPPSLVNIKELKASLKVPIPMGYSTPWPSLDTLIYGVSKGAIISVAAAPSAGKTVFVRAIHKELMDKHGIKVGIYSLEESPETVLRNLVGYEMGVGIGVPGVKYNESEAVKIATKLQKDCLIYDSSHYNGEWSEIERSMRQYYALGMKVAIVDPVSSLVIGKSASEGNELLGTIMGDMIKLTQETGLSVFLINHLNNAKGKAHEEGGRVLASEMTGSRSQYRYSSLILGLERDVLNDDEDIRDTLKVRVLKSRLDGSKSGKYCTLKYDQTLKRLVEPTIKF